MIRMIVSVFLLLFAGCAISNVKLSVQHTQWNNGYNPTTIGVETDVVFDKKNMHRNN